MGLMPFQTVAFHANLHRRGEGHLPPLCGGGGARAALVGERDLWRWTRRTGM
jgi:hypothetical protein